MSSIDISLSSLSDELLEASGMSGVGVPGARPGSSELDGSDGSDVSLGVGLSGEGSTGGSASPADGGVEGSRSGVEPEGEGESGSFETAPESGAVGLAE